MRSIFSKQINNLYLSPTPYINIQGESKKSGISKNNRLSWITLITQPRMHQFWKSLCPSSRGNPEDSETPPNINFLMSIGQENGKKQSGTKTAFLNWISKQFWKLLFSLNCHNLTQNHPNFASWGCFGNLRTYSWWWPQRFWRLMHPWRFKACILILKKYGANCSVLNAKALLGAFNLRYCEILSKVRFQHYWRSHTALHWVCPGAATRRKSKLIFWRQT